MPWDPDLRRYLEAVAAFRHIENPDRIDLWIARMRMNGPDLDRFADTRSAEEEPWLLPDELPVVMAADLPVAPASPEPGTGGIAELVARTRRGTVDVRERAEERLALIRGHGHLNAFTSVDEAAVLAEADAMASRLRRGDGMGRLAGAMIGIKDLMAVRGMAMTGGTRALDPITASEDAAAVARLRAEDAIVIGLTNLHELAYGITSTNPHFGTVGNPRAPGRIAGGSSGGSAAAVAAGLADAAVGTDTSGSIRIPAACCGIVGFKPSYDAVPRQGVMPLAWSLDHVGPMTACVADAALLFEVMAGLPDGSVTSRVAASARRPYRLFRPTNHFTDRIDPDVAAAMDIVHTRLRDVGVTLLEGTVEDMDLAPSVQFMTICCEATEGHEDRALRRPELLGEDVRVRLEVGRFLTGTDYVKAQRWRRRLHDALMQALGEADGLVLPTILTGAPPVDATEVTLGDTALPVHGAMTRCTAPFNLLGLPAITLPCGIDRNGAPLGVQIVGRHRADLTVLGIAAAVEAALG